jgi:hypothetical protein
MSFGPACLTAAALLLALAACGGGDAVEGSATMRPGENCLASGCHTNFTAAGTVYGSAAAAPNAGLSGVTVTIDGPAASEVLTTNSAGNFFTTRAFGFPATVTVSGAALNMAAELQSAAHGGCGSCHGAGNRVHTP